MGLGGAGESLLGFRVQVSGLVEGGVGGLGANCFVEEGEIFDRIFVVEDGGAGDDEVGVHGCDLGDGVFIDAAVNADEEFGFPLEESFDFGGDVVEEEFLARVGADAEEEDVVDLV